MVGGQQTAQHSDSRLKKVDVSVDVQLELCADPLTRLGKLLFQVHHEHRVQAVHQGQPQVEPGLIGLCDRLQVVLARTQNG